MRYGVTYTRGQFNDTDDRRSPGAPSARDGMYSYTEATREKIKPISKKTPDSPHRFFSDIAPVAPLESQPFPLFALLGPPALKLDPEYQLMIGTQFACEFSKYKKGE